MGKALYRKYRSKSLDDIVGQKHITDTLRHALKKDAISHAYLFTGPRGTGKTSIARILAHEINQLPYDDESTHLDIIEIDAASNRRIDEIRDLRDKVHIAPTSSRYKVYIIDEVHMLTREAFNALLKTLEEPPEHAVFILATTELHKVPDTIVSRTQKYTFRLYEKSEIVGHLRTISDAEKINITDAALELLADHGRGSFRDSISMLDQIAGFSYDEITHEHVARLLGVPDTEMLIDILHAIVSGDVSKLFEHTYKLREAGTQGSRSAQSLISILREQLQDTSTILTPESSIQLMKHLLPLTGGNATHEALEIALLDVVQLNNDQAPHTPKQPVENSENASHPATNTNPAAIKNPSKPKSSDKVKTKNQDKSKEVNSSDEAKVSAKPDQEPIKVNLSTIEAVDEVDMNIMPPDSEAWGAVLKSVKKENGTLHGILRMANVQVEGDVMTLAFQFSLHKNQLSKPANMKLFMDYVESAYGSKKELVMNVKARTTKPHKKSAPKDEKQRVKSISIDNDADNADLKNISNIFGTAELLD